MKTAKLGDYFLYDGQIVKCEWINPGHKAIGFSIKKKMTCPCCKEEIEYDDSVELIESSTAFQDAAKPLNTITNV